MSNIDAVIQRMCMKVVDEGLRGLHKPGMTADTLYVAYTMFGDDALIAFPESFNHSSAWDYARRRAVEICSAPGMKES